MRNSFRSTMPAVVMAGLMLLVLSIASAQAQTTVTASWDPNTDAYTAGYRVYYGTSSGSYQWSVDVGNQLSAPINVSPGSMYYFAVRAYNSLVEYGPASSEASLDLRPPTAQITATLGANNVATVTWQAAGNATSASINGTAVALSGSTTVTVAAQTTFTLTARNATGQTATASATVTPGAVPTAQITSTLGANNLATLTWQTTNAVSATINGGPAPSLSGSATITVNVETSFTLVATSATGQTATAVTVVRPSTAAAPTAQITATLGANNVATVTWQTANATSASINGNAVALSGSATTPVTATTTFTLTARNAAGQTATASATVTVATQTAPGAPSSMTASVSGSRATLGWRPPAVGSPANYLLDVGTASGTSNIAAAYNVGNVLGVYGDLPRGTYYARVRAANGAGVSTYSNEVRFSVGRRLRTPTGFRVTWTGTTATLSWMASAADGVEDEPTNYVLEAGTSPGASNVGTVNVGNTTSYRVEITSGNYFVRVKAQNALGESDPSEELEIRAPGTPQAPTALLALGSGATVDLRWTASAGGYAAAGYVIEAGSAPGLSDLASLRVGDVTRFTTTAPPGVYYVRVRAYNASGTSLPSNEIVVRR